MMDFIDQNLFPLFLLFMGIIILVDSTNSYLQKGVSSVSAGNRFQGIILTALFSIGVIWYSSSRENSDTSYIYIALSPLLVSLVTMVMQRKKDEIHIKKYVPQSFFSVLDRNLANKSYSYNKVVIANEDYLSSNYITMYYFDDPYQTIKIKWKDLETSNMEVELIKFSDKDFIKELSADLREERPTISFFKFNRLSLSISAILIYLGTMQLLGY